MFLSWGGISLVEAALPEEARGVVGQQVVRLVQMLHAHGVAHTDVRRANVLWNGETGQAMVIDFEQAVLAEPPRQALAPIVPNKRARRVGGVDAEAVGQPDPRKGPNHLYMTQDDISAARMIFEL